MSWTKETSLADFDKVKFADMYAQTLVYGLFVARYYDNTPENFSRFEGQEGRWSQYVNSDLLPRLHGFKLMMVSYTIAHLKLSSTIRESGAKIENTRLGKAITEESNQANKIKNDI